MRTAWAFVLRDLRVAWSYRFSFAVGNVSLILSVVSLRLVARLFGESRPEALAAYGGDYFAFALLGMGVSLLSYPVVKSFASAVRGLQVTGTFEAILATRAHPAVAVLSAGIYPILVACVQLLALLSVGTFVFGAALHPAGVGLALAALALTIVALTGIGLMSAAFVIAFKQSEPFTGALIAASLVGSGILYPTSVLPRWVEPLAWLLPLTHAIELARGSLLGGASAGSLAVHIAALLAFCSLLPLGIAALLASLTWARRTGSLSQY